MSRLSLLLLGNVQVQLDGHSMPGLETGKIGALLIYLALEQGKVHPRLALAELLWPDRSEQAALESLRFVLSNLRSRLQDRQANCPLLQVGRTQVQINSAAQVWVDAAAFREQAGMCAALSRDRRTPPQNVLQSALSLYRGSFLHDFDMGDSQAFENWALNQRERLERQYLRLLQMLAQVGESNGDLAQAEEVCRTILARQPSNEPAHRQIMRLLAANGQRQAALAQYEICRKALLDTAGMQPELETHLLAQRIQSGAPESLAMQFETQTGVPFVARKKELEKLEAALGPTLSGQSQVVLVKGEAGSGKTTLLNEFSHRALGRHPDLLVIGGQCSAYTGVGQPYLPFIESLKMLVGEWEALSWPGTLDAACQARLQQALPWIAQSLLEAAPALLDRFINRQELERRLPKNQPGATLLRTATPPDTLTSLDSSILFEQITRLVQRIARHHPLVLVVDDLQWVDPGSAALLFHLARSCAHSRLLILAAYRPAEVAAHSGNAEYPLQGLLSELQHNAGSRPAARIDLDQVDERAFVDAFIENDLLLQSNRLDEHFHATLAAHTGGNPLFTIELLRGLQERGDLRCEAGGAWVCNPDLKWDYLPERVEATIAVQINRLPDHWLDWLLTASVEGESFTAEVLARIHALDVHTLQRDLSGPLGMGRGGLQFVRAEGVHWAGGQRLSRYRFRHSLFQTYLYQQLDPVERIRRHAVLAQALEELGDTPAAVLARHFAEGGLPEKSAAYHLEAGKQAVNLGAVAVALAHFQQGLELVSGLPSSASLDHLKIHLYLALSTPFLTTSGWGGPRRQQAIQQALALMKDRSSQWARQANGEPESEWTEFAAALYHQADWLTSQWELQQAVQLGEQLLALSAGRLPIVEATGQRILGVAHCFQGNFRQARPHLEQALARYANCDGFGSWLMLGADLDVVCRGFLAVTLAILGELEQAEVQAHQSLERARRLQMRSPLGTALLMICQVSIWREDYAALKDLAAELLETAQMPEMRFFQAYGIAMEGYARLFQADPGSLEAQSGLAAVWRGLRLWEATRTPSGRGQWVMIMSSACLQAGEIRGGLEILRQALEPTPAKGVEGIQGELRRLQGELLLCQEPPDREAARACFQQALDLAQRQGQRLLEQRAAASLARLLTA